MRESDILNLVPDHIKDLQPYQSARHEFVRSKASTVFLDANENPFGQYNRYPDPQHIDLKKTLANLSKVPLDQIIIGNGSGEILRWLCLAFCSPKIDGMITMPPTFSLFGLLAKMLDLKNIQIPLTKGDFQLDIENILSKGQVSNPKIIFITTPNNPTGNSFIQKDIMRILMDFNGLVVLDEAYVEFTDQPSFVSYLDDFPSLVVVRTLSKGQGLAGSRIGVAFAHSQIIEVLNKVKPPYNISTANQSAAITRLKNQKEIEFQVKQILQQKAWLMDELKSVDVIHHVYPSDANFVMVKTDDSDKRYHQLIERGIVVRNTSRYLNCENTLRITIGTEKENQLLIKTLKSL